MNSTLLAPLRYRFFTGFALAISIGFFTEISAEISDTDRAEVKAIFARIDDGANGLEPHLADIADDVIFMPSGAPALEGKIAYQASTEDFWNGGEIDMTHELYACYSLADVVIARGGAVGTYKPHSSSETFPISTKNMFIFRRTAEGLKIWQIIFNQTPPESQN